MDLTIAWGGVAAASLAAFVANFLYFGQRTMFPVWWRALGRGDQVPGGGDGGGMGRTFGMVAAAVVAQALVVDVALATISSATGRVTLGTGALVGLGLGVVAAGASLGHRLFSGQGVTVWTIEIGGDVLGLAVMGAVLSFWF